MMPMKTERIVVALALVEEMLKEVAKISVVAQAGVAATLLGESTTQTPPCNGVFPDWGEVLCDRTEA